MKIYAHVNWNLGLVWSHTISCRVGLNAGFQRPPRVSVDWIEKQTGDNWRPVLSPNPCVTAPRSVVNHYFDVRVFRMANTCDQYYSLVFSPCVRTHTRTFYLFYNYRKRLKRNLKLTMLIAQSALQSLTRLVTFHLKLCKYRATRPTSPPRLPNGFVCLYYLCLFFYYSSIHHRHYRHLHLHHHHHLLSSSPSSSLSCYPTSVS